MSRPAWTAPLLAVLLTTVVHPVAAQEARLPGTAVARVGEETIAKREFRHWLRISIRAEDPASAPLDPPRFERCVAAELEKLADPQPRPSRRELRKGCRVRYEAIRDSTMLFLLHAEWTRQEAAAREIAVTRNQVRRRFERQKTEAFPTERAYREFLRTSGMTEADLLERVEFDLLQQRLTRQVTATVPEVTDDDVDRFYAEHRREYRGLSPAAARRAIRVRLTAVRQQRALRRFIADFRSRYRAMTVCAGRYVIEDACSNAPRS
jgi:foldase protein PrsA